LLGACDDIGRYVVCAYEETPDVGQSSVAICRRRAIEVRTDEFVLDVECAPEYQQHKVLT